MRASLLLLITTLAAWPTLAHAEPTRTNASDADALFREGKARLAAQDFVTACPLLAASYEKDPATGTLLALAVCHERQSDLVSALREYREVVQRAHAEGRGDRRDAAQARVTALEALERTAVAPAPAPAPAAPIAETPAPSVEPVVVAPVTPIVETPEPSVEPEPVVAMEAPAPAARPRRTALSRSNDGDSGGITILQGAGWATLGLGVFGLGTSLAFTLQAISKNNDSKEGCVVNRCTAEGTQDRNDARASGTAATITGLIATVLVAGGISMVLFGGDTENAGPNSARPRTTAQLTPSLTPELFGASATGTF